MSSGFTAVISVIGLLLVGLVSPRPNFLVVVESTLSYGRGGGLAAGLGAAMGDAVHASAGLFGVAVLIDSGGYIVFFTKACGGLYLAWLGVKMALRRQSVPTPSLFESARLISSRRLFAKGLACDLSNPGTVAFFASLFAFAVRNDTPGTIRAEMLVAMIMTSVIWRSILSLVFSAEAVRGFYQRFQRVLQPILGSLLSAFGLHLVRTAFARRSIPLMSLATGILEMSQRGTHS